MSVEDELAIRALVARYADAVCRRDPDAWAATWAQDCRWDLGGGRVTNGRAQTLELWRTATAKYDWVGQVVTTGLVDIEGEDRARGSWYLIEFNNRAQGDGTLHLGHYDDEYVRTADGWRFASRAMHMIYRGAMDRGTVIPLPPRGTPAPGPA
jgi:ketosteroid isomerase-like protein